MKKLMIIVFVTVLITSGCSQENITTEYFEDKSNQAPSTSLYEQDDNTLPAYETDEKQNTTNHTLSSNETDFEAASTQLNETTETVKTSETELSKETQSYDQTDTITAATEVTISTSVPEEEFDKSKTEPTVYATSKDAEEISILIVEYINEYREQQGANGVIQLSGLTKYAEYRSKQLVFNFAHDTMDERAAATVLQYGEYVDPALYSLSGEPYYTACAGEAIGMTGKIGTVDEVAKHIAAMFRNSPEHWAYVGSCDYIYIGVGVTYEGCRWYCDVALSKVNNG